jgi:hypothetical protein
MPFFIAPFRCRGAFLKPVARWDKRFHFIAL